MAQNTQPKSDPQNTSKPPENASAIIVLADGTVFYGQGVGAQTSAVGESR